MCVCVCVGLWPRDCVAAGRWAPAMAAASSTATPTMGQPLALQDAPSFAGTVIDEILSATARDATPFYWVNGNKCANFELNSGDIPYVKKNCRIYQEPPHPPLIYPWRPR